MDFFERLSQGGDWKLFVIHKTIEWVFEKLCHAAASGEDIRLNIPDVAFMPRDGPVRRLKKNLRNKIFGYTAACEKQFCTTTLQKLKNVSQSYIIVKFVLGYGRATTGF